MKIHKKQVVIGSLIIICITALCVYNYMYKEHRDIASEKVDFTVKSQQLNKAMSTSSSAMKYVDKVIQINGTITSVEQNSILLDETIQVDFNQQEVSKLSLNSQVIVKGRCVGYDDLLEVVKIDQATIITNN